MPSAAENRIAFLSWLRVNHPGLFTEAMNVASAGASGMGDLASSIGSTWDKFVTTATQIAGQYVIGKQQLDLLKLNVERAKSGQAPVDANGVPIAAPGSGYLSPYAVDAARQGPAFPQWAIIAGVAVLALLLFKRGR
jgi:hypothetical protein